MPGYHPCVDARASARLAALICLAAAIGAPAVAAQPAAVELRYEAFAGCPDRDAFATNLEARRRGAAGPAHAVQLDVRLRELPAQGGSSGELPLRVEGSILVSSAAGVGSARRIVAATCGEAADALALIAALALQGIEVEEVPAAGTQEPPASSRKERVDSRGGRRAERPRADQEDVAQGAGAVVEEPSSSATAREVPAEDETAGESSEVVEEVARQPADAVEPADDPGQPGDERGLVAYVVLAGGVATGALPRVHPMPELSLRLEQGPPGVLFWSVQAAFRISPDQTRHFDEGVVTFGWWTGLSAVCLGARSAELSASGCATLEVGALSGGASETENPRHERRAWVALGPGLTFGYDLTRSLRLVLRAELLTPLARYRLELPRGSAVHEPAALGLRAGLGIGLQL